MRIFGLAGWSGSGKTTLLRQLIPYLIGQGISVSTIKHAHHAFDLDQPGKDSYVHREAGAREVMVASATRWALQHELRGAPEPSLETLLQHMTPVDLLLIEGFKRHDHPKLEIFRPSLGKPPLYPEDRWIEAVVIVGAEPMRDECPLPIYSADDIPGLAEFVLRQAMVYGAQA
jgi:molybdopterin-guanine dinucleotide biosynthesis protein B